jgi:hypothetical protein
MAGRWERRLAEAMVALVWVVTTRSGDDRTLT